MHYDIPNVGSLRMKILSSVATKFRQFKSKLTTDYIFGKKKDKNPCTKYHSIDEETWQHFVQSRLAENWTVSIIYIFEFIVK